MAIYNYNAINEEYDYYDDEYDDMLYEEYIDNIDCIDEGARDKWVKMQQEKSSSNALKQMNTRNPFKKRKLQKEIDSGSAQAAKYSGHNTLRYHMDSNDKSQRNRVDRPDDVEKKTKGHYTFMNKDGTRGDKMNKDRVGYMIHGNSNSKNISREEVKRRMASRAAKEAFNRDFGGTRNERMANMGRQDGESVQEYKARLSRERNNKILDGKMEAPADKARRLKEQRRNTEIGIRK